MSNPIRLLLVEDSVEDAELLLTELVNHGFELQWDRVDTEADYLAMLDTSPDLILADYRLPHFSGPRALELLNERGLDIPFLVVSGTIGDEEAAQLIKLGASDYLLKDRTARLGSAVTQTLKVKRARDERRRLEQALVESERKYRLICETTTDAVILLGEDNRIQYANPAARDIFGYAPDELQGKDFAILQPERFREPHRRALIRYVQTAEKTQDWRPVERVGLHRDGREFPVEITYSHMIVEGKHVFAGFVRDITARRRALEALTESEQRFRQLAENIRDAFFLISADDGRILYVSPAYEAIWGRSCDSLYADPQSWTDAVHPDDREWVMKNFAEGAVSGQFDHEYRIIRSDGAKRWIRARGHPIRGESGVLRRIAGIATDVTERKEAGRKIRRLNRVYAVLSGINTLIVHVRERQELFNEACRIAVEHGGFGMAWISELDAVTLDVTPVAWAGIESDEHVSSSKSTARADVPRGQGVIGRAIRDRRAAISNDITAELDVGSVKRKEAIRRGYHSLTALPLFLEGTVWGTLTLYASEPDFFNEEEVKLLIELAGDISFALAHIGKEEKIARLSRIRSVMSDINALTVRVRNRQELFDGACRIAVEHGQFGIAWIGMLDPETLAIKPVAWAGLDAKDLLGDFVFSARPDQRQGQGVAGQAVRERKPVFCNNLLQEPRPSLKRRAEAIRRGYRSRIALPLLVNNDAIGVIVMYAKELDFFTEDELRLLAGLAENISFALDHIAKEEKVVGLSRIRDVMSSINSMIVRVRDPQELFNEACRIVTAHGGFGMAWITKFDPDTMMITPIAWSGFVTDLHTQPFSASRSETQPREKNTARAIREKHVAIINDITINSEQAGLRRQDAIRRGFRSFISLPLLVDTAVVGTLALYAKEANFFTTEEVGLLTELANNISYAWENIAKQEKIVRLSRIRAVMGSINSLIVRVRDRQELFDDACRILAEHGGFGIAWIGTFHPDTGTITAIAWSGLDSESFIRTPGSAWSDALKKQSIVVRAIREKRAVFSNDIRVNTEEGGPHRQEAIRRGYRSVISLPLLVKGDAVGNLSLFARETNFFTADEVKLLTELAGDISFAWEHIVKEEQLKYLAYYDVLTGLPNRTLFLDRITQHMRARSSAPRIVALILLDLERFRMVNETLGRHGGDELLRLVAQRLEHACQGKDNLAHVSADGYGVVIRGARDAADVAHAVESRLLGCFGEAYAVNGTELRLAAKAGIALFPSDGNDADTLFRNAEAALKKAKASGERYLFYAAEMNARAAQALSLETRLRVAVEARQFVLHYQPKIELASGRICGLEALIRWQDPTGGLVAPGHFIPLLEETGLIIEVGRWALAQALDDYRDWKARGYDAPRVAVNVSSIQLRQKDFVDTVSNVIAEMKGVPHGLDIEITESLIMQDIEGNIVKLKALRDMGLNISIDDFGTGYSSLGYLARLPVDTLKIDRSFIISMATNADSMAIVSTIISLAHTLNLKVIAEGVETEEQSQFLKLLKCDELQGYLFSKPLPKAQIESLLKKVNPATLRDGPKTTEAA